MLLATSWGTLLLLSFCLRQLIKERKWYKEQEACCFHCEIVCWQLIDHYRIPNDSLSAVWSSYSRGPHLCWIGYQLAQIPSLGFCLPSRDFLALCSRFQSRHRVKISRWLRFINSPSRNKSIDNYFFLHRLVPYFALLQTYITSKVLQVGPMGTNKVPCRRQPFLQSIDRNCMELTQQSMLDALLYRISLSIWTSFQNQSLRIDFLPFLSCLINCCDCSFAKSK